MNVLQICHKPPYPDTDGGTMASYGILSGLVKAGHRVDVVAIATHKHPQKPISDPILQKTDLTHIFVDTRIKKKNAVRGLFDRSSYHLTRFFDTSVKEALINKIKATHYDAVIFESLFTALYLPIVRSRTNAKCIYREHNIESLLWEERARRIKGVQRKFINNFNQKLHRFEHSALNDFDGIACICDHDRRYFNQTEITTPAVTIPPVSLFRSEPKAPVETKYDIGFLGALDWQPNIEGLRHFFKKIHPELLKQFPDCKAAVAGRGADKKAKRAIPHSVDFLGEVPDAPEFMRKCKIFTVPLYTTGGVRIKIIEAAAAGVPVVTTVKGIQGLDFPNNAVATAQNDEEFIELITSLLRNEQKRSRQADAARTYIKNNLKAEIVNQNLEQFISKL